MSGALAQGGVARIVGGYFVASGLGAAGLTVTVSVWRRRAGSWSNIITAASNTAAVEIGEGFYEYGIASGSVQALDYFAVKFITTGTADQKQVGAWCEIEANWTDARAAFLTGDAFARLAAPAGASVSADVAAVKAETALIYARQGAPAGASQSADVAAIKAETAPAAIRVAVGLASANLDTQLADLPTYSELVTELDPIATAAELAAAQAAIIADTGATEVTILAAIDAIPTNSELTSAIDAIPTAAENAAALLGTLVPGAFAAGSVGKQIGDMDAAALITDLLEAVVPGNNASGTVGGTLGRIGAWNLIARSPVLTDNTIEMTIGDDYSADGPGQSIDWILAGLPDLTGYSALIMTVVVIPEGEEDAVPVIFTGTVVNAGAASQTIRIEATSAETAVLAPGKWPFDVQVTLDSKKATLVRGVATILDNYSA